MALIDKLKPQQKKQKIPKNLILSKNNLSKVEIAFILELIKNTSFKGENVELVYNLVIKLQNQFKNES